MGGSSAGSSGSADAPTTRKHTVTQVREKKSILDYSPTVQLVKGVYKAVKGKITDNKILSDATADWQGGGKSRVATTYQSDNDNRPTATNVGGKIVKVPSPTTSEISQSNATDVTYDERKTKSKGRSMTILTSSKGVRKDDELVLGKKSLLGRA